MRRSTTIGTLAAAPLIVMALWGCDNVEWGGTRVELVPPPPAAGAAPEDPDDRPTGAVGLPTGTVVFHLVRAEGGDPRLIPVGEVSGDSLRTIRPPAGVSPEAYEARFRSAVLQRGSEFLVYSRGARVGTFELRAGGPPTACGVPTAQGILNTVPAATEVEEFLAFRRGLAPEVAQEYTAPSVTGRIRTYASLVAERIILQAGLPRPRSWPGAQRDVQALAIHGTPDPEMAATYLVGDDLAVGASDPRGYSVFYLAAFDARRGYVPFYTSVTNYAETNRKSAPRLVDHVDWTEDGSQEILIEVYGHDQSWYRVVRQDGRGDWVTAWEAAPC